MSDEFREFAIKSLQRAVDNELKKSPLFGGTVSTATDKQAPLSAGSIVEMYKALRPLSFLPGPEPLRLISSPLCLEIDPEEPTRPETVKRTFRERFFSRPWQPWVKTKVIRVTNYKPCIYQTDSMVVYHPSLEASIRAMLK